ncbi:hypothetical protein [Burkholderia vietnamiensis]|uniref:hypothetical protein n=1 Tax=Burkholderia vietnamiensis TaxID=60552 RepID=UPI0039B58DF5
MSFFSAPTRPQYQQFTFGTWGAFKTRAGQVDFLETKARLSNPPDTTPESRLTQFLRPVREALPVAEMNFNQLLQRDLDDHRVAVELVPYLLNPDRTGPAFFPPVVACLLPFSNREPLDRFPAPNGPELLTEVGSWLATEYGTAFRFDKLLTSEKTQEIHPSKLGRVSWNPESTELVIIDGQHRAMALLAIDRTINHRWNGSAEKYKSFYEPVVKRCLEGMGEEERKAAFDAVELPITIIWFPNLPEHTTHHHAARKVFVDLNKNARPPSPSRLLLLSDTDLISIFTRALLNDMRADGSGYPIYAVEYDNPSRDQASSAKWSTLTNVSGIFESVRRLICGPEKFFNDMTSSFVGRDNDPLMRMTLRRSLDLTSALPDTIVDDRTYSRDEINVENFPPTKVPDLIRQFKDGWGYLLKQFYAELNPFKVHAAALRQLRDGWNPNGEAAASLAKDAMFEGVGLYWTLKESEAHWRSDNQRLNNENLPSLPRTDVVNAWEGTQAKKVEFAALRAKVFLGTASKVEDSEAAFSTYSTAACQIGFVLAARAIASACKVKFSEIRTFSDVLIRAANAALIGRELFVARSHNRSINILPKLDTPYAVYFRYFWIELLNSKEAKEILSASPYAHDFQSLCDKGRAQYREFLIKQAARAKRSADPALSEQKATELAQQETDKVLKRVFRNVFALDAASYDQWLSALQTKVNEDEKQEANLSQADEQVENSVEAEVDEIERMLISQESRPPESDLGEI